jgi:hypothetical protein
MMPWWAWIWISVLALFTALGAFDYIAKGVLSRWKVVVDIVVDALSTVPFLCRISPACLFRSSRSMSFARALIEPQPLPVQWPDRAVGPPVVTIPGPLEHSDGVLLPATAA